MGAGPLPPAVAYDTAGGDGHFGDRPGRSAGGARHPDRWETLPW